MTKGHSAICRAVGTRQSWRTRRGRTRAFPRRAWPAQPTGITSRDGQAVPLPEAVEVDISISTPDEGRQMALLGESIGVASEGIKETVRN